MLTYSFLFLVMQYWMDYMRDSTYANTHPTYVMKMEFNKM